MKKSFCLFAVLFALLLFSALCETSVSESFDPGIELVRVDGDTYSGYLMIVHDPSRVILGVTNEGFIGGGMEIDGFLEKYGAVAGINASGFVDENGRGNGGTPIGMVISEGVILRNSDRKTAIAAFDSNHILHAGIFTKEEAEALQLRDGAGWGPVLIQNGQAQDVTGKRTGLNPRSAIGQRADGAVLLLMLDGRHPNSIGADYQDLIDIMLEYGAVTACNLDGGTSSVMYYRDNRVSTIRNISFSRSVPTAFLVMPENAENASSVIPETVTPSVSFYAHVPSGWTLLLNGEAVPEEYLTDRAIPSAHTEHIHKDVQNPVHAFYDVYAFPEDFSPEGVQLLNEKGEQMPFSTEGNLLLPSKDVSGGEYAVLKDTTLSTAKTFADFFVGKEKLDRALRNVEWKSSAYQILYEYDLWKSAKAGSSEMKSLAITGYTPLGDLCVAIEVKGVYRASYSTENVLEYPLDYTFYYRKVQDKWKIYDFVSR